MNIIKAGRQEKVKLGKRYRDTITGFEGVAYGQTEYLFGCYRVTLTGVNKDGDPAEFTFDAPQLEEIKDAPRHEKAQRTGGPRNAPSRAGL